MILCVVVVLTSVSNRLNRAQAQRGFSSGSGRDDAPARTQALNKADTLHVVSQGGQHIYGKRMFAFSPGRNASISTVDPPDSTVVFIFRDFTEADVEFAKNAGLEKGKAYRKTRPGAGAPDVYEFIGKVDVTLSDKDLCKLFGVDFE